MSAKRFGVALVLAVALCAVGFAAAEGSLPESSGTGGTVHRAGEAPILPEWPLDGVLYTREIGPEGFPPSSDPALDAAIAAWLAEVQGPDVRVEYDRNDNLLMLRAATDNGYFRTATFDLTTGREMALSDLFYDGFDYMAYINGYIATQMDVAMVGSLEMYYFPGDPVNVTLRSAGSEWKEWLEVAAGTGLQKRPFTGYPPDRGLFWLQYGGLSLYISQTDPFFEYSMRGFNWTDLYIPLSWEISPFVDYPTNVTYEEQTVAGQPASIPEVYTERPGRDAAMAAINDSIQAMLQAAVEQVERLPGGFGEGVWDEDEGRNVSRLEASVSIRDGMMFVNFSFQQGVNDWWAENRLCLCAAVFSMETGMPIDLDALAAQFVHKPDTEFYQDDGRMYRQKGAEAMNALPGGSTAVDAWLCWPSDYYYSKTQSPFRFMVRFQTPAGDLVCMDTPAPAFFILDKGEKE